MCRQGTKKCITGRIKDLCSSAQHVIGSLPSGAREQKQSDEQCLTTEKREHHGAQRVLLRKGFRKRHRGFLRARCEFETWTTNETITTLSSAKRATCLDCMDATHTV